MAGSDVPGVCYAAWHQGSSPSVQSTGIRSSRYDRICQVAPVEFRAQVESRREVGVHLDVDYQSGTYPGVIIRRRGKLHLFILKRRKR